MMSIRWGILGAGRIAERFCASLAHVEGAELVAASFRTAVKAGRFSAVHALDRASCYSDEELGSEGAAHEALLARDDLDAIYLALPHGLHHRWAIAALRAGKAVLCEKPAALSAQEMQDIARVATEEDVLFMEAMKTRFVPLYRQTRALVASGGIGEVLRVEAVLANDMGNRIAAGTDYLSDAVSGGVLYDAGIYCASWLEDFLPAMPELTAVDFRLEAGVSSFVDAELRCGSVTARLATAADTALPGRFARIVGTRGTLVVDDLHRPQTARLLTADEKPRALEVPYEVDDFYGELAHFTELVRLGQKESPVMPLAASLGCAQIIDAVRAAIPAAPAPKPKKQPWRVRVLCADGRRDPERF